MKIAFLDYKKIIILTGMLHIFFIDTSPFVDKYFAKVSKFNWEGVLPRDRYLSNLLRVSAI